MLQQRYDEPIWLSDEHNELPDDIGFEKDTVEKFDLFTQKGFELPRFPRQEQIKQLALSEQMFLIITRSNNIYRWRPEIESECQLLDLPEQSQGGLGQKLAGALLAGAKKTTKDIVLDRIFLNAHHAIICSDSGDNFYMNYKENKLRQLEQLKGKIVKTIAWNEISDENDTNEILIATKDSKILLYRIDLRQTELREAEAKAVVTIPNERQINQIETFTMVLDNSRYACVVVSTNFSVFFFYGANSLDILFTKYRDPQSVMRAESAPDRSHTSLLSLCYSKTAKPRATSFLYTNGRSLNLYTLPDKDLNETILNSFKTLKCSNTEMPIQVGLTEFHYFVLTSDQLIIHSRITQLEVQKYELRGLGRIMGMQYEKSSEAFWIYSEKGVCKVDVSNEDKDAWKLLMDQKMFIEAYEIGKKYNSPYTAYIAGLCGDQLFNKKKYSEAAQYYEKSSQNFEEIFLKYLSCDDMKARIGLEKYLKHLLEDLKGESQRKMLLGWLVELYIYRLNEIDKMTLESKIYESDTQRDRDQKERKLRQKELNDEFEQFLKDYQHELPQDLVYLVMVSHGRLANCVEYAKLNQNFEMIIQHHINEENYKETIKNLKSVKDKSSMEVIQKYSYILMKHEPEQSLQILMSHIKKFDSTKIIGGLMNIPIEKRNCGIQFLEHSINILFCAEKSINNILIFFLTQPPQKDKLHDYLLMQEQLLQEKEKVNFDLDFALRLFKQASLIDAQIIIYGMMGLYTESVTLALDYEMIDKAKDYASRPLDDDKKKKLWMMIAERLLKNNQSIDKVIELTKQADMIKIEDLLPHFNENIKIEHFKDEICNSLRKYNEDIDKLKDDMKKLSQNSDQLKNELKMTKNKFLIIDTQQKCEHCGKHLFNDTFYIFPCNHGFHKDCIVKKLKSLPQHQGKMAQIETYDMTMQSILMKSNPQQKQKQQDGQSFFQLMNIFGTTKQEQRPQSSLTQEEEKLLKETKEKFDLLVANECIFCGPSVVDSIQIGFEIDAEEKSTWSL